MLVKIDCVAGVKERGGKDELIKKQVYINTDNITAIVLSYSEDFFSNSVLYEGELDKIICGNTRFIVEPKTTEKLLAKLKWE